MLAETDNSKPNRVQGIDPPNGRLNHRASVREQQVRDSRSNKVKLALMTIDQK